jgi:hypothetical protein
MAWVIIPRGHIDQAEVIEGTALAVAIAHFNGQKPLLLKEICRLFVVAEAQVRDPNIAQGAPFFGLVAKLTGNGQRLTVDSDRLLIVPQVVVYQTDISQ